MNSQYLILNPDPDFSPNRDELIYRSYVQHGYTMKENADYLEVHFVSVSRSIKRYEVKKQK